MEQFSFAKIGVATPETAADGTEDHPVTYPVRKKALFKLLARAEEKERHRIARDLHDTTAQDLVAIDLNLRRLGRQSMEPASRSLLSETCELLKQAQRDLRTMSYVLHPPPVQQAGLAVALQAMVQGLTKRAAFQTGFETNIAGRLPAEIEETLYRVTQEALINVCRHAQPDHVSIRCHQVDDWIVLEIEDDGVGFDAKGEAPMLGVGLRAIRARVKGIGGLFEMVPLARGIVVRARIPYAPENLAIPA